MLKSIHKYRQKDIQMSAFYSEQKLPSQNIYKNGLLLSGDSFIKTEIGPPVPNGIEIETVKIYYDKHSNQRFHGEGKPNLNEKCWLARQRNRIANVPSNCNMRGRLCMDVLDF